MILILFTVLLLLTVAAFFSAAETALTTVSKPMMHQMAQEGDIRAQTIQVFENLRRALGSVGADFKHVIKTNIYLTDPRYRDVLGEVRKQYLSDPLPASTLVVESQLVQPAHELASLQNDANRYARREPPATLFQPFDDLGEKDAFLKPIDRKRPAIEDAVVHQRHHLGAVQLQRQQRLEPERVRARSSSVVLPRVLEQHRTAVARRVALFP